MSEQDRGGKKGHPVRFIDFDNLKNNEFVVTRQFKVLGTSKHIIADVAGAGERHPARHPRDV